MGDPEKGGNGVTPSVIKKLDETVVNRIAAGEVIQRPANALKELMENCLDAGSTSITVTVKSGGLKMLQISDNGCGIRKEDMNIVCERFTTSKLEKFEDLQSIGTFGFRGEALASISHVAHVTITTRTKDSRCAWKGSYSDGVMKGEARPTAGNQGTVINVEDLFYNISTRKKALNNPAEEHAKIADVVSKYAIHNSGVAFTLKKAGESNTDVKTAVGATVQENIRSIYGGALAKELLEIDIKDDKYKFTATGLMSTPNYEAKRMILLLFINNRLVDCSSIRKAISNIYSCILGKGAHPFAFINLNILPQNVDVNVHPTKHEVHFLHEDSIVEILEKTLESKLLQSSSSRNYAVQSLLPSLSQPKTLSLMDSTGKEADDPAKKSQTAPTRVYDHQMVRTDSKCQKLDAFLEPKKKNSNEDKNVEVDEGRGLKGSLVRQEESDLTTNVAKDLERDKIVRSEPGREVNKDEEEKKENINDAPAATEKFDETTLGFGEQKRVIIRLRSILELQADIRKDVHKELATLFKDFVFVGCVNYRFLLLQHMTSLYLINLEKITEELFYQIMVFDFGNFGVMRLSTPPSILELAKLALDLPESGWAPEDGTKDEIATFVRDLLVSRREMLEEYFSLEIDEEGNLCSLPLLLNDYTPCLDHLPLFVIKLAGEVNWEEEKSCFESICRKTAHFYAFKQPLNCADDSAIYANEGEIRTLPSAPGSWPWTVEHVLCRTFRSAFYPSQRFAVDGSVLNIACLNDLYKVFERC